jgi:hypothetical protein
MDWAAGQHQQAMAALRTAIEHAGPLSHRLWERLAQMHAASGDLSVAADAQAHVIASPYQALDEESADEEDGAHRGEDDERKQDRVHVTLQECRSVMARGSARGRGR